MWTFEVIDVESWVIWSKRRWRGWSFDYGEIVVCGSLGRSLVASDLWCVICVQEM
jgi:hypothetical protein